MIGSWEKKDERKILYKKKVKTVIGKDIFQ